MPEFVHLHVASCFSVHFGTAWPEWLVDAQTSNPAAGLTDRDGASGLVRHIRACQQAGVAAVAGVDLRLDDGTEVTVLAHGHDHGHGWASLCRLISAAHGLSAGRQPSGSANRAAVITRQRMREIITGGDAPGCTVLLGPWSDVGQAVRLGDDVAVASHLREWRRLLGDVAVEVVCHYARPGRPASVPQAAGLLRAGLDAGLPVVASNAVRYLTPDDVVTGDVLDAAGHLVPLNTLQPHGTGEAWLKPPGLMRQVLLDVTNHAGLPSSQADELMDATVQLAARCAIDPADDLRWRQPKVPELDVIGLEGDPQQVLAGRCREALPARWPNPPLPLRRRALDRLDDELSVIGKFGFASYFLVIADIVDMIKGMGVRVQARGSGAGSLVNYLLGISSVDPLEHDLLFERFLGVLRSTLPDIDIDVESARRHEIYRAISARYGSHRTTLLSMQNQYRARGALRDGGLALGLPPGQIDLAAKSMWRLNAGDIDQALTQRPELQQFAQMVDDDPALHTLIDVSTRLDRLPRHISMHPCGVILSDENLLSLTPTQPSGLGIHMSQFDKDDIDDLGLLKLDVLGVRMQSAIAYTIDEIERIAGQRIDLDAIPPDDKPTFEAIQSTHTLGMFQIESPGQRELVGKMQPDCQADLVADISLFRPGPMKGNMITPYVEAKLGIKPAPCLHRRFQGFLADSYGVMIYHEHVLRILSDCMGVSLAEADEIRRRMGAGTEAIEQSFRAAAAARRGQQGERLFTDRQIDQIWKTLREFGSFGFCKAHACAFAHTTYQSAWLKTHYPAQFMAGILEHDPGMYPKRLLLTEAKRLGIPVLGVDVNASTGHYRVEDDGLALGIRLPFSQIGGISSSEIRRLTANQPYRDITDLIRRARPHRPTVRKLAAIGALDALAPGRSRGEIIACARRLTAVSRSPSENQDPLLADDEPVDTLAAEIGILGLDVTKHILDPWRDVIDGLGVTPANQLLGLRNNSLVTVVGARVASQTPPMRSGQRVVFLSLDDGTGIADCTFFPDAQRQVGADLFRADLLAVQGHTRRTGDKGISILADMAWDLAGVDEAVRPS